jgi:lysozyme family protein
MNQIAFSKALAFTLKEEGGFVDNVLDHGGRTNRGITQNALDAWLADQHLPFMDVKDLDEATTRAFYADVWVKAHCDDMSLSLAIAHFDWSVNHGCAGALETLQQTLQVTADGVYGTRTRTALLAQDHDDLFREYNTLRREWYQDRVKAHSDQAIFLKGWLGRVDRLDAYLDSNP